MRKNTVAVIMLALILIGISMSVLGIQSAKAEPRTWTVDNDRIECPDADFTRIQDAVNVAVSGDTVFVYNGIYYEHLSVSKALSIIGQDKSETIVDASGHGVVVTVNAYNVGLSGFTIRNSGWGSYFSSGSGIFLYYGVKSCIIRNNIVSDCRFGITGWYSSNNVISSNTVSETNQGIAFDTSHNETVIGNTISNGVPFGGNPPYGVQFWGGYKNRAIENTITKISYLGISLDHAHDNVISGNTISDIYGDGWERGIRLVTSYNNGIIGNTISNIGDTSIFVSHYNNTVVGNTLTNSSCGIYLMEGSHDNIISENTISDSVPGWASYGMNVYGYSNTITGNIITNISYTGIRLNSYAPYPIKCKNNVVTGNTVSQTNQGIAAGFQAPSNIFVGNDAWDNYIGLFIFDGSDSNTFIENDVSNNYYGIVLFSSDDTKVYHNNFVENTEQVLLSDSFNTVWDNDYPSGGNYWSNYVDVDFFNGPNQDLLGMDGIWDHPYVIDAENQDRYPLVKPWPIIPVATDVDPDRLSLRSKGNWITVYMELPVGYDVNNIDVESIKLNGAFPVDFSAPILIGDYDLDGIPDLMVKFNRAQLESYIYNSLGIKYGEVTLKITGQLSDGTPFDGSDTIFVNYAGDVNNDGKIDILDAATVSAHWYPGPPRGLLGYDANADLNNDGLVNILDSGIVSSNWGQTVP